MMIYRKNADLFEVGYLKSTNEYDSYEDREIYREYFEVVKTFENEISAVILLNFVNGGSPLTDSRDIDRISNLLLTAI